jgi:hypothetical protein
MMNLKLTFKSLFISTLFIILYGCGQPDPTDWYSYRDRNRKPVEVKYNSAEILPGTDKKDIIRVSVTWKNPGSDELIIDNEKFSLDVSDVKLNPENFDTLRLAPNQEVTKDYDFLLVSTFVDKTKYKLSFEDWAEIPVFPVRK